MRLGKGIEKVLDNLIIKRFAPKTIINYRARLSRLYEFLGNIEVEKINSEDLTAFLKTPFCQKLARGTYNHYIAVIRSLFNYLHTTGYIQKNPARLLEFVREEEPIIEYLTIQEIKKLLKVRYPYGRHRWKLQLRDQLIFRLAIFCGLRTSDIRNLRFRDIEWDQREIFVRKSKNLKDRIVPITSNKLYNWLRVAYYCRKGVPFQGTCGPDEYVVQGVKGKRVNAEIMGDTLRRCLKHAGIVKKWPHIHMLRHTCATMFLRGKVNQRGMDLRLIQELLGHASIKTTEKYAHVDKTHLRQEMLRALPQRTI